MLQPLIESWYVQGLYFFQNIILFFYFLLLVIYLLVFLFSFKKITMKQCVYLFCPS